MNTRVNKSCTFGLVQIDSWDKDVTGAVTPALGTVVVRNDKTGQVGFLAAGTAAAPTGYTLLPSVKVYAVDGPNGVTLSIDLI